MLSLLGLPWLCHYVQREKFASPGPLGSITVVYRSLDMQRVLRPKFQGSL